MFRQSNDGVECGLLGGVKRIGMERIAVEDYNLNISRYISTATADEEIDLTAINVKLVEVEGRIKDATSKHNEYLKELGLPLLP